MQHVQRFFARLRQVHGHGSRYTACCPAHNDSNPSLDIRIGSDGAIRPRCRSVGCSLAEIVRAMDLSTDDLSPDPDEETINPLDSDVISNDTDVVPHGTDATQTRPEPDEASLALRDDVYRQLLLLLPLQDHHRENLRQRGLDDDQIDATGCGSLNSETRNDVLAELQSRFSNDQLRTVPGIIVDGIGGLTLAAPVRGMLIPVRDINHRFVAIKIRRDSDDEHLGKYTCLSGVGSPSCGTPVNFATGSNPRENEVRVTEGELKAYIAAALGELDVFGIAGVNNWQQSLPILEARGVHTVRVAFDADWPTKPQVSRNLIEFTDALRAIGYRVVVETWPLENGKGIDDLLRNGHQPELLVGGDAQTFLTYVCNTFSNQEHERTSDDVGATVMDTQAALTTSVLPFPISIFPESLQRYATRVAASLGCPVDLVAMPMIVLAATAIGASRALEVKPGWKESPRIYGAVVAPPGSAKTPAEKIVSRPVFRLQNQFHQAYKTARAAFEAAEAQLRPQRRARRRSNAVERPAEASTAATEPEVNAEADSVESPVECELPAEPHLQRVTVCDATTESLAPILVKNPRGIVMVKDELTAWILSLNQYKGGKGSDRQFYLSCWSGETAIVDRKSQSEPIIIPKPFLNVMGGVQPDMLSVLADAQGRADGFIDRILFAFPDKCTTPCWTDECVDPDVERDWADSLGMLFHLEMVHCADEGIDLPRIIQFTNEGKAAFVDWYDTHVEEMKSTRLPIVLINPWSKLRAYFVRLALVIQLMRYVCREANSEDVDPESVSRAILLIDYFKSHARKVYSHLDRGTDDRRAEQALTWIRDHGGACSIRELQRSKTAGIKKKSDAQKMLKDLTDRGFGTLEDRPASNGKRVTYFVIDPVSGRVE